MGAQQRVFRQRISAVRSTKKITKAMELIAASRIVKAQQRVAESTPYAEAITETVTIVASSSSTEHVLTTERENPGRVAVLVITSDRGLAGAYNGNVLRAANHFIREPGTEVEDPRRFGSPPRIAGDRAEDDLDTLLSSRIVGDRPLERVPRAVLDVDGDRGEDLVLALEVAVQRPARYARVTTDVGHREPAAPVPSERLERPIEDPLLGGRARAHGRELTRRSGSD